VTLTKPESGGLARTRSLLNRLIEVPDLARALQALPVQTFAALVRKIGLEDAGELVALATSEQLAHAFDEDLFVSEHAGQRESLDVGRFAVWLEILLEAGDEVAANRVAELDEDFVAHALSGIVLVLDEDALRQRLDDADEDASRQVDKALESALTEDLDGYTLIAKQPEGWDAALSLILALDRSQRALLVRLLDRLAHIGSGTLDDLDELSTLLTEGESLAEDVEAAREERRSKHGYVEPRAAHAFLALARQPLEQAEPAPARDALTRAYFRELDRSRSLTSGAETPARQALRALPQAVLRELDEAGAEAADLAIAASPVRAATTAMGAFMTALREMSETEPKIFGERMEEFAYLVNVLVSGHERGGVRMRPKAAADAVFATVCYGAFIQQGARRTATRSKVKVKAKPAPAAFAEVLRRQSADVLFRIASSALATGAEASGLLYSEEELDAALR